MFTGYGRGLGLLAALGIVLLNAHCGVPMPDAGPLSAAGGDDDDKSDALVSGGTTLATLPDEASESDPNQGGEPDEPQPGGSSQPGLGRLAQFVLIFQGFDGEMVNPLLVTVDANDPLDGTTYYKIVDDWRPITPLWKTSIYASVEMGDANATAVESTIHFYLRAASADDPNVKGVSPLTTLGNLGQSYLAADAVLFEDPNTSVPVWVTAYAEDSDEAAGLYMMNYDRLIDENSYFYELPGVLPFVNDTRQVPLSKFVDPLDSQYSFLSQKITVPTDPAVAMLWLNVVGPTPDPQGLFPVYFNRQGTTGWRDGEVFEVGAAATVTTVVPWPEE